MKLSRRSSLAVGIAAVALSLAIPAQAASAAETPPNAAEADFNAFVASLNVAPETQQYLEDTFAALPDEQQQAYIADPQSLITFEEEPTEVAPVRDSSEVSTLADTGYRFTNTQNAQIFGVTLVTFNLDFRYEANYRDVTRILLCTGSASGVGVSTSSSPSSYISGGTGTCEVRTQVSAFFQGFPVSFTKIHSASTVSGSPKSVVGSIRNA